MHKNNDVLIATPEDLFSSDDSFVGPAVSRVNRLGLHHETITQSLGRLLARTAAAAEEQPPARAVSPARAPVRRARQMRMTPMRRAILLLAPFVTGDVLALTGATVLAFLALRMAGPLPIGGIHSVMPVLALAMIAGYAVCGLYTVIGVNPVVELRQLTRLNSLVFLAAVLATYVVSAQPFWRTLFTVQFVASLFLVPVFRSLVRQQCGKTFWWGQPALVFGPSLAADEMARLLLQSPHSGLRPIAVVCEDNGPKRLAACGLRVINARLAARFSRRSAVSYGVVLTGADSGDRVIPVAKAAGLSLPHILLASDDAHLSTLWSDSRDFGGMHALALNNRLLLPWPRFIKRVSDLIAVTVGGLLISPIIVGLALAVKFTSTGPIFFGHTRIGRGNRRFKAWKFRTMKPDADQILSQYLTAHPNLRTEWERDHKLKDDPRITALGKFLRKTSLDELPQLWNVLLGDMSLVGPRPIVNDEIDKYGEIFQQYIRVTPGITGLWQVSGRNNTTYPQRVAFDNWYIRNWSPWLDLYLLARTVRTLICRDGAY